jgi:hypothetical protein
MPMATTTTAMAEDTVNTPVVVGALATIVAKKGKSLPSMYLLNCTDDNAAIAKPSVPSLARRVHASTVAKKGELLLNISCVTSLIDFPKQSLQGRMHRASQDGSLLQLWRRSVSRCGMLCTVLC